MTRTRFVVSLFFVLLFVASIGAAQTTQATTTNPAALEKLSNECGSLISKDNLVAAAKVCIEAAQQGDAFSQYEVGEMYFKGKGGLPKDVDKAVEWYGRAGEGGYRDAQLMLGLLYHVGGFVPLDLKKSRYWYAKADIQEKVQQIDDELAGVEPKAPPSTKDPFENVETECYPGKNKDEIGCQFGELAGVFLWATQTEFAKGLVLAKRNRMEVHVNGPMGPTGAVISLELVAVSVPPGEFIGKWLQTFRHESPAIGFDETEATFNELPTTRLMFVTLENGKEYLNYAQVMPVNGVALIATAKEPLSHSNASATRRTDTWNESAEEAEARDKSNRDMRITAMSLKSNLDLVVYLDEFRKAYLIEGPADLRKRVQANSGARWIVDRRLNLRYRITQSDQDRALTFASGNEFYGAEFAVLHTEDEGGSPVIELKQKDGSVLVTYAPVGTYARTCASFEHLCKLQSTSSAVVSGENMKLLKYSWKAEGNKKFRQDYTVLQSERFNHPNHTIVHYRNVNAPNWNPQPILEMLEFLGE